MNSLEHPNESDKTKAFLLFLSQYVKYTYESYEYAKMNFPLMGRTSLLPIWRAMTNEEQEFITNIMDGTDTTNKSIRTRLFGSDNLSSVYVAQSTGFEGDTTLHEWWDLCNENRDKFAEWYAGVGELDDEHSSWSRVSSKYGNLRSPMDIGMKEENTNEDILGMIVEIRRLKRAPIGTWSKLAASVANIAMWANDLDGN